MTTNETLKLQTTCEILLKVKAIELSFSEPFLWASGLVSPLYCDNRRLLSYPNERNEITNRLIRIIKELQGSNINTIDAIAGTATAGIPWGAMIADRLNLPFLYVRSEAKSHGKGQAIEGDYQDFKKIVLMEDLISTGKSSLKACEHLRDAGMEIIKVISIFSYGLQLANNNFAAIGVNYLSLTDFNDLKKELEVSLSSQELHQLFQWYQQL